MDDDAENAATIALIDSLKLEPLIQQEKFDRLRQFTGAFPAGSDLNADRRARRRGLDPAMGHPHPELRTTGSDHGRKPDRQPADPRRLSGLSDQ